MKKVNRRQFAKMVGAAALAVPLAASVAWPQEAAKKPEQPPAPKKPEAAPQAPPADAAKPTSKLKLTPEQEETVKKAVERRDRQLAALRSRVLPYDAEPAFVFQVRRAPRRKR